MKKTIKPAFVDAVPIMMGYLVLGFGSGIVFKSSGYGNADGLLLERYKFFAHLGLFTTGGFL